MGKLILGYIYSKRKLRFNVDIIENVTSLDNIDRNLPLLIVGLEAAREYCGDKFSIINKKISDNVFWTFLKTERKNDFEKDIKTFINFSINNILNNIIYEYINILTIKYSNIKKLYNIFLNNSKENYIYCYNDMLYLYHDNENIVYGLSLKMLKYIGMDCDKIINMLLSNDNNVVFENYPKELNKINLKEKEYTIPYLLFKANSTT